MCLINLVFLQFAVTEICIHFPHAPEHLIPASIIDRNLQIQTIIVCRCRLQFFDLLLDEATASLDIENELAVKQAIANLLKEKKTVVMIVHTLSIVKNADQILVMGDGRIAESGTHEELLAKGGKYAAMWNAEQKISA